MDPLVNAIDQVTISTTISQDSYQSFSKSPCEEGIIETPDARMTEDRMISKYSLKNILGQGSYGIVYKAVDPLTGELYAIKEMDAKKLKKSQLQKKNGGVAFGFRGRLRGRGARGGGIAPPSESLSHEASNPNENPIGNSQPLCFKLRGFVLNLERMCVIRSCSWRNRHHEETKAQERR
jgi:serine/threonine protein kinase